MEITANIASISQLFSIVGAGLATSFSNPFQLVRYRMQTMPQLLKQGSLRKGYEGIFDCVKRIKKEEGIRAFWKGNLASLLRFYPSQTINFTFKEIIQSQIRNREYLKKLPNIAVTSFSGMMGGWLTLFMLYPFDFSRLKLSNDISGKNGGIIKCLTNTLKVEGLRGIYLGASISFVGVGIFRGTYFGIFDSFKNDLNNSFQRWLLGYLSTFMAILFTYPSDTVRRRIMMTSCQNYKYRGFKDCCTHVYRSEGIKSFYRGGSIIMFQSMIGATILFLYDKIARDFKNSNQN